MASTPHPHSRWNWKWKLFAAFTVWALVAGGLHLRQQWQVVAYYEEMRAQGLPTNSVELQEYYRVPEGVANSTQEWVPALQNASAAILKSRESEYPPTVIHAEIPEFGQPWKNLGEAEEFLQRLTPQIEAIYRATEVGGQAVFSESSGAHRDVARLLRLESAVAAHRGESTRSLKAVKAIFALANAKRGQPDMISLFASNAIRELGESQLERWLPHCQWTDTEIESLQQVICEIDFRREFQIALAGDCANLMVALDEERLFPFRTTNELAFLRQYSNARRETTLPWHEMISRFRVLDARVAALKRDRFSQWTRAAFVEYAPKLEDYGQGSAIDAARQAFINAGLAAQRHRLRHGRLPTSLEEIDRDLFGKMADGTIPFTDPFDGKPLRFKLNEQSLVIYSVGMNQTDDGGVGTTYSGGYQDIGFNLSR